MINTIQLKITDFGPDFLEIDIEIPRLASEIQSIALIVSLNTGETVQEHLFEEDNSSHNVFKIVDLEPSTFYSIKATISFTNHTSETR